MKKIRIIFIFILLLNLIVFSAPDFYYNYKPKTDPVDVFSKVSNNNSLKSEIDLLLKENDAFIGIDVINLQGDDVLSFNSNKYFRPASITKLFTSYLSLKEFGKDKRFDTYIYLQEKPRSEMKSDIYIKGMGDPFLTIDEYRTFLKKLKLGGINTIYGDLIFDFSYYKLQGYGEGWIWNDPQPQILPLNIWTNNNAISKDINYQTQKERVKYLTVYLLNDIGINFQGNVIEKTTPETLKPYYINKSETLEKILKYMIKESDNFISEHLFRYLLNKYGFNNYNDFEDIIEFINEKLDYTNEKTIITDGTGLSMYNLLTPKITNDLIIQLINNYSLDFVKNLLTTSYEKGIFYNRYKDSNLWVKTGTLYTDSALSGILESRNNQYYIFTIYINNDINNMKDVKDFEIKIIKTLYENLK